MGCSHAGGPSGSVARLALSSNISLVSSQLADSMSQDRNTQASSTQGNVAVATLSHKMALSFTPRTSWTVHMGNLLYMPLLEEVIGPDWIPRGPFLPHPFYDSVTNLLPPLGKMAMSTLPPGMVTSPCPNCPSPPQSAGLVIGRGENPTKGYVNN